MSTPYGFVVLYERRKPNGAGIEVSDIHRKGSESAARKAAQLKSGFVRITEVIPRTREQYIAAFGDSSQRRDARTTAFRL